MDEFASYLETARQRAYELKHGNRRESLDGDLIQSLCKIIEAQEDQIRKLVRVYLSLTRLVNRMKTIIGGLSRGRLSVKVRRSGNQM